MESATGPTSEGCRPTPFILPRVHEHPSREQLSSHIDYSSVQRQHFSLNLKGMQAELLQIDNEIKHLQRHRQNIIQAMSEQKSLLAPIRRIPEDVLSEIFMLCPEPPPATSFLKNKAPFLLTQVCSRWRAVALSTQALWSSMIFDSEFGASPGLLQLWLLCSGGHPLDLDLSSLPSATKSAHNRRTAIIETLIEHQNRWQNVALFIRQSEFKMLEGVPGSFPSLRNIALMSDGSGEVKSTPLCIFENAPKLTEVTFLIPTDPRLFSLPWSQLKTYIMLHRSPAVCLQSLQQCSNVITCRIHCTAAENDNVELSVNQQELPNLRSFRFRNTNNIAPILDHLITPSLTFLKIENSRDEARITDIPVPLVPFLERSSCRLQTLDLVRLVVPGSELIAILQQLPELNVLCVREWPHHHTMAIFTTEVFQRLTSDGSVSAITGHPILVPRLRTLEFRGFMDVDDDIIVNMIDSRRNHPEAGVVARIWRVRLSIRKYKGEKFPSGSEARERARIWQKEGMDVKMGGKNIMNLESLWPHPFGRGYNWMLCI